MLSVYPDQPSAPASYMSGSEHDGDAVILIGLRRFFILSSRAATQTWLRCRRSAKPERFSRWCMQFARSRASWRPTAALLVTFTLQLVMDTSTLTTPFECRYFSPMNLCDKASGTAATLIPMKVVTRPWVSHKSNDEGNWRCNLSGRGLWKASSSALLRMDSVPAPILRTVLLRVPVWGRPLRLSTYQDCM